MTSINDTALSGGGRGDYRTYVYMLKYVIYAEINTFLSQMHIFYSILTSCIIGLD